MNLDALRSRIDGAVLTRDDDGFADEVAGFNTRIIHSPDVVVGADTPEDVAAAVQFARANGFGVAVHATGHGAASAPAVSDGVMVSTKRLDSVSIDAESRTAVIGAGARWADVHEAAAPHGLTPIPGSSPGVGAVGYTLGGGLGPLSRSHGFTSDWARGFTVATGTGELVTASASENPDLFWALRGGKVGLGIVTEMRLELAPLPSVHAGSLYFDETHIETAFRAWIEWTATVPDDVTTSAAFVHYPPFEFVPEPLRGRHLLTLRFAFPGGAHEGERLAEGLRSAAPVLLDTIGELPTSQLGRIHNDPDQPGPSWDRGVLLTGVDQDFADALLDHIGAGVPTPFVATEVRHLGGRTRVDVAGGSAVGGRSSDFTLVFIGVDPALFEREMPDAADAVTADIRLWVSPETNVNFGGRMRSIEHFESAWPAATRERLTGVRSRYDPDGLFAYGPGGE